MAEREQGGEGAKGDSETKYQCYHFCTIIIDHTNPVGGLHQRGHSITIQ